MQASRLLACSGGLSPAPDRLLAEHSSPRFAAFPASTQFEWGECVQPRNIMGLWLGLPCLGGRAISEMRMMMMTIGGGGAKQEDRV